ncbi:MAG: hypothetical protein ACM3JJ_09765 [Hyphomicrobiales bacterium]
MRIRNPRRIVLLGVLLSALVLVAAIAPPIHAKPINWNDPLGPSPTGGDGDGSVVKAAAMSPSGTTALMRTDGTTTTSTTTSTTSFWQGYLAALRLGYGWRFLW